MVNCAQFYEVFDYIDPSRDASSLATCLRPIDPSEDPEANITTSVFNRYKLHLDRFTRVQHGLMAIDVIIMKAVTPETRIQIQSATSVHEKLCYLRDFYRPSNVEWHRVLLDRINE